MIHHNPANSLLRAADRISLIDPSVPGWRQLIVDNVPGDARSLMMCLILEIPVSSTDPVAVQAWRDKVSQARR